MCHIQGCPAISDDGPNTGSRERPTGFCGSRKPFAHCYLITLLSRFSLFFSRPHCPDPIDSPAHFAPRFAYGKSPERLWQFLGHRVTCVAREQSSVWKGPHPFSRQLPKTTGNIYQGKDLQPSQEERPKRYLHSRSDGRIYKLLLHLLLSGKIHWAQNR